MIFRIWEKYNNVSFTFNIDDKNIASLQTLQKVCKMLDTDFEIFKTHHNTELKFKKSRNKSENKVYNITGYYDGELLYSLDIEEEKLLKIYSKDVIENEGKLQYSNSIYEIKSRC